MPAIVIATKMGKGDGLPPRYKSASQTSPAEKQPAPADVRHEQGESNMDFAAIGAKFGMSPEDSRAFAYDVLEACMKSMGGAKHEAMEPPEAEEAPAV